VTLTEQAREDPLFGSLPSCLVMQATHVESVLDLPPSAVLLGRSDLDPHQAFRLGRCAWSVQFHPEFDVEVVRGYIETRRDLIEADGLDVDAILSATAESDHGIRLLRRFAQLLG
jgi:GMP synthase (glutamine-hydrolysing)